MEFNQQENQERTTDIYEQLPFYPKPPLIPLPDWQTMASLKGMGIKQSPVSSLVIKTLMALTGFKKFYRNLPETMENYLRTTNTRGAGLFALINSASLALRDDQRSLTPAQRAATLIFGAYGFYDDLMSGKLEPDKYKDQVLEMGQYPNLFSTCLTIEGKTAKLFKSKRTDQITVLINGRFFILNVGHPGKTTTLPQLANTLQKLVDRVQEETPDGNPNSPGIISGVAHPVQLRMFGRILKNPVNKATFEQLRHSFLTLCLDINDQPQDYAEAAKITQSKNFHNRWYHSALQIVVFGNGKASTMLNFNTYIDGNPMMRGSAEIERRAEQIPVETDDAATLDAPKELRWQLNPMFIERATEVARTVLDDQKATFVLDGFGKTFYQNKNLAPVPAFMVAVDMAAKTLIGQHVHIAQYLSVSKYRCMNLANADATTPEVQAFVDYVEQENFDKAEARKLMEAAIESQRKAYSKARKNMPPSQVISIFVSSQKGFKKLWITSMLATAMIFLRLLGLYKSEEMQAVASHPDIKSEIKVVGRPGIRLPYIKYFGFHYQIMDDKTVITFMPSTKWQISNQKLLETIREKLKIIDEIFQ